MAGKTVNALTPIDASGGKVFVEGKFWSATSDTFVKRRTRTNHSRRRINDKSETLHLRKKSHVRRICKIARLVNPCCFTRRDHPAADGPHPQTTLRSVLGQAELDELLSQRDKINLRLQEIIDRQTDPWGIKVTAVEVRDVVLPDSMKRAMAGQAESERERRAKIINAEGEFQAAEKLVQAASMISEQPIALQLRFLQTMKEISSEHNTTTILPIPIDMFAPFIKRFESQATKEM